MSGSERDRHTAQLWAQIESLSVEKEALEQGLRSSEKKVRHLSGEHQRWRLTTHVGERTSRAMRFS